MAEIVQELLTSPHTNKEVDAPIPLGNREFTFEMGGKIFKAEAELEFRWLPTPAIYLECPFISKADFGNLREKFIVSAENISPMEFNPKLTRIRRASYSIEATATKHTKLNTRLQLKEATFLIPNCEFTGSKVCRLANGLHVQRTPLKDSGWEIMIDFDREALGRVQTKKVQDGNIFTHVGRITRSNGELFSELDLIDLIESISISLSLMRGTWTSPFLIQGFDESNKLIVQNFTVLPNDRYQLFWSVFQRTNIDPFEAILSGFISQRKDKYWRGEIERIVGWYIESNPSAQKSETSIVLVQAALETLTWIELVEKQARLSADEFNDLTATEKIRILLSQMKLTSRAPASLPLTASALKNKGKYYDAPHLLTEVRNSITHPRKRRKNQLLESKIKNEVKQIGLQYLELALVYVLGYRGNYWARVKFDGETNHSPSVPWAKPIPT